MSEKQKTFDDIFGGTLISELIDIALAGKFNFYFPKAAADEVVLDKATRLEAAVMTKMAELRGREAKMKADAPENGVPAEEFDTVYQEYKDVMESLELCNLVMWKFLNTRFPQQSLGVRADGEIVTPSKSEKGENIESSADYGIDKGLTKDGIIAKTFLEELSSMAVSGQFEAVKEQVEEGDVVIGEVTSLEAVLITKAEGFQKRLNEMAHESFGVDMFSVMMKAEEIKKEAKLYTTLLWILIEARFPENKNMALRAGGKIVALPNDSDAREHDCSNCEAWHRCDLPFKTELEAVAV